MNKIKPALIALAICLAAVVLCSCGRELPPDDGTPAPAPLDGVYSCDQGSLTFNGDGKSVIIDFADELAAIAGLPAGRQEGDYVFLFRNEKYRYDKAEYFRVRLADGEHNFRNAFGVTNEQQIAIYFDGFDEMMIFEKTDK